MRDLDTRILEDYGSVENYIRHKKIEEKKEKLNYVKRHNSLVKSFRKSRKRKGYAKKYKRLEHISFNDIS